MWEHHPESPYYLLMKNRRDEAMESLKWFRGPQADIIKEIDEISSYIYQQSQETVNLKEAFLNKITLKCVLISFGIMFLYNF